MNYIIIVALLLCGGCFASFCNCVAYRIPRRMNWVTGRSVCPNCGKELKMYELIPIISCLILRAKCSRCKMSFGWYNFITELIVGLCFVWIYFTSSTLSELFIRSMCAFTSYLLIAFIHEGEIYHSTK